MTTELTKAAQQALEALKLCYAVVEYPANGTSRQDKAIAALERALTQRPAAQTEQATPEPVGEPVARVELMQTGGNAGLATRIVEIDDPLRDRLRPGDVLYTRPAPGVPEGWREVIEKMVKGIDHLAELARQWEPDYSSGADRKGWVLAKNARDEAVDMLAAAQAKGD